MPAAFSIEAADDYFRPDKHIAGRLWDRFDDEEKRAALSHARRVIERIMGDDLTAPAATADNSDVREDYALYEQALWILQHSPFRANAEDTGVAYDMTGPAGENTPTGHERMAPETVRWLHWHRVRMLRG